MRTLDSPQDHEIRHGRKGTVMVPVDPKQPDSPAVAVAVAVADQASLDVELVAAVTPGFDELDVRRSLRARSRELGDGVPTRWRSLGRVDPAEGLLERAADGGATVVCLDTHARGAAAEMAFGSISEAVVRCSAVPVLACGPHLVPAPRYTRLLVGLDGSAQSEHALSTAVWMARLLGAEIALAEVLPPDLAMPSDVRETAYLTRIVHDSPVEIRDYDTAHDRHPARALAAAADERPGTILVVGTQGRSGLRRLRLGSVALDAVRRARCPVLVVPPTA